MDKPTNPVGRPPLNNRIQLGFRLNPEALAIADRGSMALHTARSIGVSRSAWIRELINMVDTEMLVENITPEHVADSLNTMAIDKSNQVKITCVLEEDHRIKLRQIECHAQSLDWTIHFGQNETLLLLIHLYGEKLTENLKNMNDAQ